MTTVAAATIAIGSALGLSGPTLASPPALASSPEGKRVVGYLYATTNGEGINEVIRLARYNDGTVGEEKAFSTGVRGAANHLAPALGDYDAQGQTQIVGNFLLTADTGADMVSLFRILDSPSKIGPARRLRSACRLAQLGPPSELVSAACLHRVYVVRRS